MKSNLLKEKLLNNGYTEQFRVMYGTDENVLNLQKQRYIRAVEEFEKLYGDDRDIAIYSASGRTEICGNHTDHN